MEDQIYNLQRITKSYEFQQLDSVIKSSIGCLLKISQATHQKLTQHFDLYYDIVSKTEEQNIVIEKQITRLINITDHFDQESLIDPRSFLNKNNNGLDKIMIEEVKTLAQALIDRRLQQVQQELLTKHDFSIQIRILQQQLDVVKEQMRLLNNQKINGQDVQFKIKQQKFQLYEQFSKSSRLLGITQLSTRQNSKILKVQNDIQNIRHSMRNTFANDNSKTFEEMRFQLEKKIDKKELIDFKNKVNKQLVTKTTISQVQGIMIQFQNKIFDKINQVIQKQASFEAQIMQSVKIQLQLFTKDLSRDKRIKQIRKTVDKLEKAIDEGVKNKNDNTINDELVKLTECYKALKTNIDKFQIGFKDQIEEILELISSNQFIHPNQNHTFNLSTDRKQLSSIKLSSLNIDTKNLLVPWQEQDLNLHKQNYLWERNKTSLYIICPGMYYIKAAVYSVKKIQAQLLLNGQTKLFLKNEQEQWKYKQGIVLYFIGIINIPQKSKLSIKLSQDYRVDATLILTKLV